eukprot:CAMPEP_0179055300 /NCGR_PEP_ID=MMETSP0796-20121207/23229_1 /TAXON_ID=73915 /ORGANISM="Pyrodinium bahamense, Strain pbaha01" /LENGTH=877 /DNA_ID=CAMNT_0020751947 /DNA_START=56 /DNA_END=2690 /DNA_ORIENTATION=+
MVFRVLLSQLASEHDSLHAHCEALKAENESLKAQLQQIQAQSGWQSGAHPDREAPCQSSVAQVFLADPKHMMAPEEVTSAAATEQPMVARPSSATRSGEVRRSAHVLRLHFKLKDEELVQLQPVGSEIPDVSASMQEMSVGNHRAAFRSRSVTRKSLARGSISQRMIAHICNPSRYCSVLHPESHVRIAWDVAGMCVVAYDMTVTPVMFIVSGPITRPFAVCDWIVNAFWSLDIVMSFRTGFQLDGTEIEMRPRPIAVHYSRTWLIFDVFVILPDYVSALAGLESHVQTSFSLVRFVRFFRLLRLLRVIKLKRLISRAVWRINSNKVFKVLKVCALIVSVSLFAHIFACGWYAVGDSFGGWVEQREIQAMSVGQRYLLSVYWAFSQLHGGSEVHPQTVPELIFIVLMFPVTITVTALFISYTTSMLVGEALSANALNSYRWTLRSYLLRHGVSSFVSLRVKKFVEEEAVARHMRQEEQKILELIPTTLIRDMMFDVRGRCVVGYPVFQYLGEKHPRFMRHLCNDGFATEHIRRSDIIFEEGDACSHMRFVSRGCLAYHHRLESNADSQSAGPEAQVVNPDTWLSEACLWTVWEHCGKLESRKDGVLFALDSLHFGKLVTLYRHVHWNLVHYARHFILHVNTVENSDLLEPIDFGQWNAEYVEVHPHGAATLPWFDELPGHLARNVCEVCVQVAQRIAKDGLDENRPHHGFTIIIGDTQVLHSCGASGFNPFLGHKLSVLTADNQLSEETFETMRRNAFHADGAVVIDSRSGVVTASGWFVSDISQGGKVGGARSRSAKAVAQQAGQCYVIKCSEDSRGQLSLYLGTRSASFEAELLRAEKSMRQGLMQGCDGRKPGVQKGNKLRQTIVYGGEDALGY